MTINELCKCSLEKTVVPHAGRAEKNVIRVVQVRRDANSDELPLLLTSHNFLCREDGRPGSLPFAYRLQRLLMPLSSCLALEAPLPRSSTPGLGENNLAREGMEV